MRSGPLLRPLFMQEDFDGKTEKGSHNDHQEKQADKLIAACYGHSRTQPAASRVEQRHWQGCGRIRQVASTMMVALSTCKMLSGTITPILDWDSPRRKSATLSSIYCLYSAKLYR